MPSQGMSAIPKNRGKKARKKREREKEEERRREDSVFFELKIPTTILLTNNMHDFTINTLTSIKTCHLKTKQAPTLVSLWVLL